VTASLLRERAGAARVTNVELFFDLVYVAIDYRWRLSSPV
jgi:low temperature requirement protein LtrA